MFSSSTVLPHQYCKRNGCVFFFFQSLYLAPIIRQMNKKLCAPRLLGNFFFPSPQGREVQTSSDAHTCLQASRSQALTISKKNHQVQLSPPSFHTANPQPGHSARGILWCHLPAGSGFGAGFPRDHRSQCLEGRSQSRSQQGKMQVRAVPPPPSHSSLCLSGHWAALRAPKHHGNVILITAHC